MDGIFIQNGIERKGINLKKRSFTFPNFSYPLKKRAILFAEF